MIIKIALFILGISFILFTLAIITAKDEYELWENGAPGEHEVTKDKD